MSKRNEQFPLFEEFVTFITERWSIHQKRLKGLPPPWTEDPILHTFRFTNVRREDDRVTRWIHAEWLRPHETDYDTVVFAMCVARLLNLPAALEAVGYPTDGRWMGRFKRVMAERSAQGLPVFTAAYMINAVGATKGELKSDYLARRVLPPLWEARRALGSTLRTAPTLRALHEQLLTFHGFGGGFMSAQVIADVKWTPAGKKKEDWDTFAAWGPGSRRGLGWVCGDRGRNWKEEEWYETLLELRKVLLPCLPKALRTLDSQNLQNCLCEGFKYFKTKYAGARPKQFFRAKPGQYLPQ